MKTATSNMSWSTGISCIFILLTASFGLSQAGTGMLSPNVGKWDVFEINLTTTNAYSNPYLDVWLNATFIGPNNAKINIDGFWDGANTWKIRMAPTDTGTWRYVTMSSDSMLDGNMGSFEVIESNKKGFIKVNPNYPYSFMYDDGTPFFWMGDTLWSDPGYENFTKYIDTIKENGYNNYHTVVAIDTKSYEGFPPFEEVSSTTKNYDKLNPSYFKEYDKRVIYANSNGIIPQLYLVWSQDFILFTRAQFERYEKYMIARYAAYNVIWIISAEYNEESTPSEYDYHGNFVSKKDPYNHLISIHPTGATSNSKDFATKTWNSYIMQQMGYDIPLGTNQYILNDRKFNKPVVNGEPHYLYDGEINVDTWRKQNWLIAVAGGYFDSGYQNLFLIGYNSTQFDLSVPNNVIGMKQMKYLSNFFNNISFWNMNPNNSVTSNGYALANPNKEYVIYLPTGGSTTVNLSAASDTLFVEWYNPRTGTYQNKTTVQGGASITFTAPDSNDWVLHINSTPTSFFQYLFQPLYLFMNNLKQFITSIL